MKAGVVASAAVVVVVVEAEVAGKGKADRADPAAHRAVGHRLDERFEDKCREIGCLIRAGVCNPGRIARLEAEQSEPARRVYS